MLDIGRFIEDVNAAKAPEEAICLLEKTLKEFGYDRFCYSLITDHPSLGLKAGHGVAKNYPQDWMSHYHSKSYEKRDPVPRFCFSTNKPFTWSWLVETQTLGAEQQLVMNEANEAKLLDGAAIPICGVNGELAGIGLASSAGGINADMNILSKVRAIVMHFHMAYTELEKNQCHNAVLTVSQVQLTAREKEILLWAAEGKGDQVIADILGISYSTIRFHMNNIFHKLNANERTLAIAKAIRHGLILPSYVAST